MKTAGPKYQEKEKKARQQPTELFRIWLEGSPTALYYTSGDQNITYDNRTYEAKAISRGPVEFDTTSKVTRCDITVGYLLESVQAYLLISPPDDYWIEVRRFFRDTPGASVIQFLGKMKSISFKGAQANIECTGFEDHLNFAVPHYRYQRLAIILYMMPNAESPKAPTRQRQCYCPWPKTDYFLEPPHLL